MSDSSDPIELSTPRLQEGQGGAPPGTRRTRPAGKDRVRREHLEDATAGTEGNTETSPIPGFVYLELGRRRWVLIPGLMSPLEKAVHAQEQRGAECRCAQ